MEDFIPTNREKKRKPKSCKRFWCHKCDANKVYLNEKCQVCGMTHDIKKTEKANHPLPLP